MKIIKRNGLEAEFDPTKIYNAIRAAWTQVYGWDDTALHTVTEITQKIMVDLEHLQTPHIPISVIQSFVENRLLDFGKLKVAEAYIEYRIARDLERYGYEHINVNLTLRSQ